MCKICNHPQRTAIDRAIISGDSCRSIAAMFATSKDAVYRHKNGCLKRIATAPPPLPAPEYQTTTETAIAERVSTSIINRVSSLVDVLEQQASECASDKDRRNMNGTATALLKALELNARLTGELSPNQVNVAVLNTPSLQQSPEWGPLMQVLDRHPEIRVELTEALQEAGL